MSGTGWRVWRFDGGRLTPPLWRVRPSEAAWRPGWNVARCHDDVAPDFFDGRHDEGEAAPGARCFCGISVCPSLAPLRRDPWVRARVERGRRLVWGLVEYEGRACPTRDLCDPPGTLRVERARLLRLDLRDLPHSSTAAAVALKDHYGVPVITRELAELQAALGVAE